MIRRRTTIAIGGDVKEGYSRRRSWLPTSGGRVHALRAPFADGLYAEAGASRVPTSHNLTLGYARLFGLPLVPFAPADIPSIRYADGQRTKIVP